MLPPEKYAVIGSSGAGKTTLVYQVAGFLKVAGVHVETIISGDRHLPFPAARLEDTFDAQAYVILNQARLEAERSCQRGIDVVLSDRSVLDFLIYARATFPNAVYSASLFDPLLHAQVASMEYFAHAWVPTYRHLFYLPQRDEYDTIEQRPSHEFAQRVDRLLRQQLEQSTLPITFLPKGGANALAVASFIQQDAERLRRG